MTFILVGVEKKDKKRKESDWSTLWSSTIGKYRAQSRKKNGIEGWKMRTDYITSHTVIKKIETTIWSEYCYAGYFHATLFLTLNSNTFSFGLLRPYSTLYDISIEHFTSKIKGQNCQPWSLEREGQNAYKYWWAAKLTTSRQKKTTMVKIRKWNKKMNFHAASPVFCFYSRA